MTDMTSPADAERKVDLEAIRERLVNANRARRMPEEIGRLLPPASLAGLLHKWQSAYADDVEPLVAELERLRRREAVSIAVLAFCPECRMQHVDRGEWETRPHRSHLCEHCGHVWRLAMVPTVGVAVLAQAEQKRESPQQAEGG